MRIPIALSALLLLTGCAFKQYSAMPTFAHSMTCDERTAAIAQLDAYRARINDEAFTVDADYGKGMLLNFGIGNDLERRRLRGEAWVQQQQLLSDGRAQGCLFDHTATR
jgi:hypothetical protein